jgi:hypothetical protein
MFFQISFLEKFCYEIILGAAILRIVTYAGNFYFLKVSIKCLMFKGIEHTVCILLYSTQINKSVSPFILK